jgi:signal peptidase I
MSDGAGQVAPELRRADHEARVLGDRDRGALDGVRLDAAEPVPSPVAAPQPSGATTGRAAREIVETLLLAVVIFVGVRLVVLNFRVDGLSMAPNLHNREMLLVNRNAYFHFDLNGVLDALPGVDRDDDRIIYPFDPPERGDIVVFDPPVEGGADKPYIKRVIGLPGETIEIRQDGHVYVDGQRLDEPYLDGTANRCAPGRACDPTLVPEGHVYVLGDNRGNSSDSRVFGPVDIDAIIGKAWVTYWPADDFGLVPHQDYPGIEG